MSSGHIIIYPRDEFSALTLKHRDVYMYNSKDIVHEKGSDLYQLCGGGSRSFKLNGNLLMESAVAKDGEMIVKSAIIWGKI